MSIKYYNDITQGSDEWLALRCGILTASEVKHILTEKTLKIANNDKTRAHVYEIAAQRITEHTEPQYISDDMLRGMEDEILAIDLYNSKYQKTTDCAFVLNDDYGFSIGYSPDALVDDDGLVEVKSRAQKYQLQTIAADEVPSEYMLQLQTGLFVTKRNWIDFVSYCGGMPMFVKRVGPIQEYQDAILEAAETFEKSVFEHVALYKRNACNFHMTKRNTDFEII